MDISERIQEVRKNLKLTQTEFGNALGVSRDVINNIENDRLANPSQKTSLYKLICREFNISEQWLFSGEGSMFASSAEFSLDDFARAHGATALEMEIMKAYFSIDEELRKKVLQEFQKNFAQDGPAADPVVDAEAEYIKKISGAAQKKASTASNTTDEDAMA